MRACVYVCVCVRACMCTCVCVCVCVCVCEGGGRVVLVRHLCVQRVSFWCLELCVFLFYCLLHAPWAQLRRSAQRPHYYYYHYYYYYYYYYYYKYTPKTNSAQRKTYKIILYTKCRHYAL